METEGSKYVSMSSENDRRKDENRQTLCYTSSYMRESHKPRNSKEGRSQCAAVVIISPPCSISSDPGSKKHRAFLLYRIQTPQWLTSRDSDTAIADAMPRD